jgi:hypothetical protein
MTSTVVPPASAGAASPSGAASSAGATRKRPRGHSDTSEAPPPPPPPQFTSRLPRSAAPDAAMAVRVASPLGGPLGDGATDAPPDSAAAAAAAQNASASGGGAQSMMAPDHRAEATATAASPVSDGQEFAGEDELPGADDASSQSRTAPAAQPAPTAARPRGSRSVTAQEKKAAAAAKEARIAELQPEIIAELHQQSRDSLAGGFKMAGRPAVACYGRHQWTLWPAGDSRPEVCAYDWNRRGEKALESGGWKSQRTAEWEFNSGRYTGGLFVVPAGTPSTTIPVHLGAGNKST